MDTTLLAQEWTEMWGRLTGLQREAVIANLTAVNDALPENAALWATIRTQAEANDVTPGPCRNPSRVAMLRAALDAMGKDDWRTFNSAVFVLYRGNAFDEKFEALDGGGIQYAFERRYVDFIGLIEEEALRWAYSDVRLLDVGCWQGTLALEMAQRGLRTYGTDISRGLEEVIAERVKLLKIEDRERFLGAQIGWAHEVLPTLPQFDIVTCQETLEHVPTVLLGRTCDAILEVCADGGSILVTVPGWDDGWPGHLRVFTEEGLAELFRPDENEVEVVRPSGGACYTTLRVRKG